MKIKTIMSYVGGTALAAFAYGVGASIGYGLVENRDLIIEKVKNAVHKVKETKEIE